MNGGFCGLALMLSSTGVHVFYDFTSICNTKKSLAARLRHVTVRTGVLLAEMTTRSRKEFPNLKSPGEVSMAVVVSSNISGRRLNGGPVCKQD